MTLSGAGTSKRAALLAGICLALVVLLACESSTPPPGGSYAQPPVVTSAALQPTIEQAQVEAYVAIVRTEREQRELQVTLDALYGFQTATAQAEQAAATAQAARSTATAYAAQTTATAEAARVTATAHARQVAQAATSTAQAARATATTEAVLFAITQTASADQFAATAALRAEEIRQAQLRTRREELVYPLRAYGPWLITLLCVASFLWAAYRLIRAAELRVRAVPRDSRGDAPVFVLDQRGGKFVVLDPDRAFSPATVIGDQVTQPQFVPSELQAQVTARDQAVDLASRGQGPGRRTVSRAQAARLLRDAPPAMPAGPVQIVPPHQVRAWLRDVEPQAMRKALTLDVEAEKLPKGDG